MGHTGVAAHMPMPRPAQDLASQSMLVRAARFAQLCWKVLMKKLGKDTLQDRTAGSGLWFLGNAFPPLLVISLIHVS